MAKRSILSINASIPNSVQLVLNALPFLLIIVGYHILSTIYLGNNPNGKLLPSFVQMGENIWRMATQPEQRSGEYLIWIDMLSSLKRIVTAVAISAFLGLFFGLTTAFYPLLRATWMPFITFMSNVPMISIVAILMVFAGVGELFKVLLIFLGTFFIVARDVNRSATAFPAEQTTKALSLGASEFGTVFRLMLPQVMPHLLSAVKMVLGAAWLYLIASEMIAATSGMGYRIALVRRYLDMETIIPYVLVITLIAFFLDGVLRCLIAWLYPWYQPKK